MGTFLFVLTRKEVEIFSELFGNANITRALLFLLVNEQCYPSQVHRYLGVPLTPLQHAFERLEKGGIVLGRREGKRRLYELNPEYPLSKELEHLLRKAYAQLSPTEKKAFFYLPHQHDGTLAERERLLYRVWKQLKRVRRVRFTALSRPELDGIGEGEVRVEKTHTSLIFHEEGKWQGRDVAFRNVFRWTISAKEGLLGLEHLRFGPERPVFLFHLQPSGPRLLESVHSHLCGEDAYFGQLHLQRDHLRLHWRILGPRKNQHVDFTYLF